MTRLARKSRPKILACSIAAIIAAGSLIGATRAGADQFWDGLGGNSVSLEGGAGTWNLSNLNWADAGGTTNFVFDSSQTSIFGVAGGTVTLGENVSFSNLTFTTSGYLIDGNGKSLTPIGAAVIDAQTGVTVSISANMTGAGSIELQGPGKISLNGASSYSGGTTLSNGTLFANSNTALGTGPLTITSSGGPTILATDVQNTALANAISVQGDFSFAVGPDALDFYLNGAVDLNGANRTITNLTQAQIHFTNAISNGDLTFGSNFSAPGDFTVFLFDGASTTGAVTIGNGVFFVNQGTNPVAVQGDVVIDGNAVFKYYNGSPDQIADTSTVTVNSNGNFVGNQRNAGLEFSGQSGSSTGDTFGALFGTGTIGLASATMTVGSGNFSGTITDGFLGFSGGGLTKNTGGTLILSGSNNYTGTTTVMEGVLQAGSANTFSRISDVVLNAAGTLDLNDFDQRVGSIAGAGVISLGTATLTTGHDNTNTTFSGVIQESGGLTKVGTGTTTLSGGNTYTGATTVNAGTLVIDTATSPTVLDPSSSLVMGGGTFQMTGLAGTSQSQILAGLTLNAGASVVSVDNNAGTDTTLDLRGTGGVLGITRNAGTTVDFAATTGTLGTDTFIMTAQANDGSDFGGIIGGWATVNGGAALAANDGAGNIVAYTGYTDIDAQGPNTIADGTTNNVRLNAPGTTGDVAIAAATTNINTLTQNTGTASTIDTSPGTLRLGTSGGLFITPGSADLTIGNAPDAGTLTAGGNAANVDGEIVVGNFSTSVLTINSTITDNGTGVVSLTKTGTGTLTLHGSNTYTGTTTVNAGVVNLDTTGANAISGNVVINGGEIDLLQADQIADTKTVSVSSGVLNIGGNNETVAGVQMTGGSIDGSGGVLTSTTDFDLQAGSVSAVLGGGVGLIKTSEGTVSLSSQATYTGQTTISEGTLMAWITNAIVNSSGLTVGANGTFDLNGFSQNVASLTGAGTIQLGGATLTAGSDGSNTTFSGIIQGDGGLTKEGIGTLTLTSQNVYSGVTTISDGTLQAGVANAISRDSAVTLALTGTFDLNNFDQKVASIAGSGTILLGSATLTLTGSTNTNFSGAIDGTGGLIKEGSSTLTLSGNLTYTGTTAVNGGTLSLTTSLAGPVTVDNGATFSVASGGTVVLGNGVTAVAMTDVNTLTNSGSVQVGDNATGIAAGNGNAITNSNNLMVGNNSTAIDVGSDNGVLNNGTITAGNNSVGIRGVSNNDPITNAMTLTVGDNSTGIRVLSLNAVANTGTLTFGNNSVGIQGGSGNSIENSGSIQGGATGSTGVVIDGTDNTVTNYSAGTITANKAMVFTAGTGGNLVLNYGTMTGTSGVAIDASASMTAIHYINLDPNNATFDLSTLDETDINIVNFGTINGTVLLGSGDDTVTLVTRAPKNLPINGGGGVDTLFLVGTQEDTLNLSKVTNFEKLVKQGGGTWTLTGRGSFGGGTRVEMGKLYVQGTLNSDVTVFFDGCLGGNGTIGGFLHNYGILTPGNSPGKITIGGDFVQGRGGTLVIEIAGKKPGQYDVVEIGGHAMLDGTLRIERVGNGPRLKTGERLEFLTAKGGVEGEFAEVYNELTSDTMVKPEVVYDGNSVAIEGVQGSYVEFAKNHNLTHNQRATAAVVDAAAFGGQEKKMVAYLNERQLEEIPSDLDRVAPEELTAVYRVGVALADVQHANLQRRMDDLRLSSRRPAHSPVGNGQPGAAGTAGSDGQIGKTVAPPAPEDRWGTFFTGTGQVAKVGRTENARGFEMDTGGLTVGLDYRVTPNFAIGVTAGYANTSADLVNGGSLDVNGGKIGTYATYFTGGFHADAILSTGFNSYETNRSALNGTARGKTEGTEWDGLLGVGYDWQVDAFTFGPVATFEYTRVNLDGFKERGSLAPLRIPDQDATSIRSTLGFKAAYNWEIGRIVVRPEVRGSWQREYGDRSFALDSSLASGAGGLFTVYDTATGRDSFLLGAGVSVVWNPDTLIYLFYDGDLGREEYQAHNLSGGLRLTF